MIIVSCQHIKKYHGANAVLEDITFDIHEKERVGLIGRNGSGKSTLLQIIAGIQDPDEGQLAIKKGTKAGYLAQIRDEGSASTVYDALAIGYREAFACRSWMTELEAQMSSPEAAGDAKLLERLLHLYAEQQEAFEQCGGYEMEARIAQVANGLGIGSDQFDRAYAALSGGEKTKVGLASLLIERPSLLLLDEPTNHLDMDGVEWLENYLAAYDGTCLIVSHDRYFLDRMGTKMIEIEDGECFVYPTHYSGYVREKEERLLRQFANYQEQQKTIKKMKETIKQLEEWGRVGGNEKFFRRAASMQKALDRMEKIKRPVLEERTAEFDWKLADRSGRMAIILDGVSKRFGGKAVLDCAQEMVEFGNRIALVGKNGSGKTTLFKLIMGEIQPDQGTVELGSRVEVGYLAQEEQPAGRKESVLEYFRREAEMEEGAARSRLAKYLFYGADVFKAISGLSGGEWTRLRLALLVHRKPNLLLLDEPTNHLDIASREALEEALEEFPGTIVAISHDRYFINKLAGSVWELREGAISKFIGNFDDYREKCRQMEIAAAHSEKNAVKAVPASSRPAKAAPAAESRSNQEGAQTRSRLEAAIAQQEEQLREADAALNDPANAADPDKLGQVWAEREAIADAINRLYEQWLPLTEAE